MLYLLKCGDYMKIGFSDNLRHRFSQYNTHNPNYEVLCISEGTKEDEDRWHTQKGEWCKYDQSVIDAFVKQAYLQDFYFETDLTKLCEDDVGNLITKHCNKDLHVGMKHALHIPSIKIINDSAVWTPSCASSYNYYIHKLIQTLPYKPKKESERSINVKIPTTQTEKPSQVEKSNQTGLSWIVSELEGVREYTYCELEMMFSSLFKEHNLTWNKNNSIKLYFPQNTSRRRTKKGVKETYYKFNIF